jgi:hypothetical protein
MLNGGNTATQALAPQLHDPTRYSYGNQVAEIPSRGKLSHTKLAQTKIDLLANGRLSRNKFHPRPLILM